MSTRAAYRWAETRCGVGEGGFAGRPHGSNGGGVVVTGENGGPGHQHIAPAATIWPALSTLTPPSTSSSA